MHVILMKIMVKELWTIWKIVETKEAKERSIPIMHEDYVILSQVLIIEEPHSLKKIINIQFGLIVSIRRCNN